MNNTFSLYKNCIPVKGSRRSLIVDLQNRDFHFIPNDLQLILTKNYFSLNDLIVEFGEENESIINEYVEYLLKNRLLNIHSNKDDLSGFIDINLEWKYSSHITNLLIDITSVSNTEKLNEKILECADVFLCEFIQIRIYEIPHNMTIESLIDQLLNRANKTIIRSVEIYLPFSDTLNLYELERYITNNHRITKILIHSIPINIKLSKKHKGIYLTNKNIYSNILCGYINIKNFEINVPLFTEAQHHNTCLNRKISIDVNGDIKNCPSMAKSYGNIKDTTLAEAIEKPGFKDLWDINKDKIHVCKDCEFRYICTDCRAYIENPEDIYSKPLKCGYNPYTAEWEEWSTNPLKQKAIEFYGMQELVKKEPK